MSSEDRSVIKRDFEDKGFSVILAYDDAVSRMSPAFRERVFPTIFDIGPGLFKEIRAEENFFAVLDAMKIKEGGFTYDDCMIDDDSLAQMCLALQYGSDKGTAKEEAKFEGSSATEEG